MFLAEETGGAVTCFPGRIPGLVFRKSGFFPYQGGLAGDKDPRSSILMLENAGVLWILRLVL